jgi:hypothetical protein
MVTKPEYATLHIFHDIKHGTDDGFVLAQDTLIAPRISVLSKLEFAQQMAGHADPKTTKIYDRRADEISQDEVERIGV